MSGQVYVVSDAGRGGFETRVTYAARGRHGEPVEYGTRGADGVLRVDGRGFLCLPSRLGAHGSARRVRADVKHKRFRVVDCDVDTITVEKQRERFAHHTYNPFPYRLLSRFVDLTSC